MRHEWQNGPHTWGADSVLGATLNGEAVNEEAVDCWPEEMLRLAEENAALKTTVDPLVSGIATLEAQLAEVREEALRLERENRELRAATEEGQRLILAQATSLAGWNRRAAEWEAQRNSLEAENTALADECVKLARERDSLASERDALKSIVVRLTLERDGWKAEAERLAAEIREREEREETPKNLATFFTYVEQANRILALEADNERLRAERATLTAKLDAIRGAAMAATHDCSLRQDVFFLLSVPSEGEPVLPGEA